MIRGVVTDSHIPWGARALLVGAAALASVFTAVPAASAGVADPDPTFGAAGTALVPFEAEASADALALAPDGDIVVVGRVEAAPDTRDFAIARLNPDGSLDEDFSGDGRTTLDLAEGGDDYATGVAVRPDGRIVVVGTSANQFAVVQLTTTGKPDEDFAAGGSIEFGFGDEDWGHAHDVVLDAAGSAIVVGEGDSEGDGDQDAAIARVTASGDLDGGFAANGRLTAGLDLPGSPSSDHAFAVALSPDGEAVIAGEHFQVPNVNGLFGRIDSSGAVQMLESLGSGRYYGARDIAVLTGGMPVAVGYYQPHGPPGGSATAWSFGESGLEAGWEHFDPEVRAQARSIAPLSDGGAIVVGTIGPQSNLFLLDPSSEAGFVAHAPIEFAASEVAVADAKPVVAGSTGGTFAIGRFLAPTVDLPNTKIVAGPHGKVAGAKVKFRFRADPQAAGFECKLDRGRWRPCKSPLKLGSLDRGRHRFKVRAVSGQGEHDPTPAKRRFKIA